MTHPKYTVEEFNDFVRQKGFINNKNYNRSDEKIKFDCITCNYTKTTAAKYFFKLKCKNCSPKNGSRKYSLNYVKNYCNNNQIQFLDNHFSLVTDYHNFKCKNNHVFQTRYCEIIRSFKKGFNGCKHCAVNSLKLDEDSLKKEFLKLNIILLDSYTNANTKCSFKCTKCESIWKTTAASIRCLNSGCPRCACKKNEKLCFKYIKELLNINFSKNRIHIKDNSLDKKYIIPDFQFEINNKKYIIEYNGIQHYEPIKFSSNWSDVEVKNIFEIQKKRDIWLRNYCNNNSIVLIEIDGRKYEGEKIKNFLINKFLSLNLITFDDLILNDYKCHAAIKAPLAV